MTPNEISQYAYSNMNDITITTFEASVRKRPVLYIGNKGLVGLFTKLLTDIVTICGTDNLSIELTIATNNKFVLRISTSENIQRLWDYFLVDPASFSNYLPRVLFIVSSHFQISHIDSSTTEIHFTINQEVIPQPAIDYITLIEKTLQFTLLNRHCTITTFDKRHKVTSQNYFHFPQGIFYLFDRAIAEALGKPEFTITIDTTLNGKQYQVALAYRTDWFPAPHIASFANDFHTVGNGSLVEGILQGWLYACKTFAQEHNLSNLTITRKKLMPGLILIGAVRGQTFTYEGSGKEKLADEEVGKAIKQLVAKSALEFFSNEKEKTEKFFLRFNANPLSGWITST